MITKPATRYFPQLTGIRAIAAYMVFFFHFNPFPKGFLFDFFNEGATGVTFFFVLSGFLIAYRYKENLEFSKGWFSQYMLNRVARIYPMYFLLTVLTFIFARDIERTVPIFILNITFLRGFSDLYKLTGIQQGWSLTVEECFYILAPFIFILSKKIKLFLQAVIIILTGVILVAIFKNHNAYGFFDNYAFLFQFTFFGRCIEFFIGIQLAMLINGKKYNLEGITYTIVGLAGSVLCIIFLVLLQKQNNPGYGFRLALRIFTNNVMLAFFIGVLFFGLINERTLVGRLFGTPLFELLGKSSYIFYLIHEGIINTSLKTIFPNPSILRYLFIFMCLNLISILLYKYVETPLNKYIRGLGKRNTRLALEKS